MNDDRERHEAWVRGWQAASVALERVRRLELRGLTAQKARLASDRLLALGAQTPLAPHRRTSSGLVEQQRLFAGLRP